MTTSILDKNGNVIKSNNFVAIFKLILKWTGITLLCGLFAAVVMTPYVMFTLLGFTFTFFAVATLTKNFYIGVIAAIAYIAYRLFKYFRK